MYGKQGARNLDFLQLKRLSSQSRIVNSFCNFLSTTIMVATYALPLAQGSLVPRPHPPRRVAWYPLFTHAQSAENYGKRSVNVSLTDTVTWQGVVWRQYTCTFVW